VKNHKRSQKLIINVDIFFKRFVNFVGYFFAVAANSELQFVDARVRHSTKHNCLPLDVQ